MRFTGRFLQMLAGVLLAISVPLPYYEMHSAWARLPWETDYGCRMITHHCDSWYITGFDAGFGRLVILFGGILLLSGLIDKGKLGLALAWFAISVSVLCLIGNWIGGPILSDVISTPSYGSQLVGLGALLGLIGGLPRILTRSQAALATA